MIAHEDTQKDFYDGILEKMVCQDHAYRKIKKAVDFGTLVKPLEKLYSKNGTKGEPIERGFKCLLIQYWEDLSDRQLERYARENMAMRWFCGYKLDETTPDHSYFGKLRKRIGLKELSKLFNRIVKDLEEAGYVGNIFHFVDASSFFSKVNLWEARDRAIKDRENNEKDEAGNKKMNNKNVSKYSSDKEAKFGCKGKKKFWFGYKRHVRVDMRNGIITKTAATSADIPDAKAFVEEELCPDQGMVFLDKGYDSNSVSEEIEQNNCANATIQKINKKTKNKDLDRWRSGVRMPYENVFRNLRKTARYRGKPKVGFQITFEAIAYNLKRLIKIHEGGLVIA